MADESSVCLSWTEHNQVLCKNIADLFNRDTMLDVSLICEGESIAAHKLILAACSTFFRETFCKSATKEVRGMHAGTTLNLEDLGIKTTSKDLRTVIEFIYKGQVVVPKDKLESLLFAAQVFGVGGLLDSVTRHTSCGYSTERTNSREIVDETIDQDASRNNEMLGPVSESVQIPVSCSDTDSTRNVELDDLSEEITKEIGSVSANVDVTSAFDFKEEMTASSFTSYFPTSEHGGRIPSENNAGTSNTPVSEASGECDGQSKDVTTHMRSTISIQTDIEMTDMTTAFEKYRQARMLQYYSENERTDEDNLISVFGEAPQLANAHDTTKVNHLNPPTEACVEILVASVASDQSQSDDNANIDKENRGRSCTGKYRAVNENIRPISMRRSKKSRVRNKLKFPANKSHLKDAEAGAATETTKANEDSDHHIQKELPKLCEVCGSSKQTENEQPKNDQWNHNSTPDNQCELCGKIFGEKVDLNNHSQLSHAKERAFDCHKCDEKFCSKETLKLHVWKKHKVGEVYQCRYCGHATPIKASYVKHLSTHSDRKDYICDICGKKFKSKGGWNIHIKGHKGDEHMYKCDHCNFKTLQKFNLIKHLANKHGKDLEGNILTPNFKCHECGYTCIAEHILKAHTMRKHTIDKPFKCNQCAYSTVEKAALEKHVRIRHTNERPYMCEMCGFSSHTISGIARHRRTHTGLKPYKCQDCGQLYADKKRLRDHLLKHANEKPYICEICGYACRRKDNLQIHMRKNHQSTSANIVLDADIALLGDIAKFDGKVDFPTQIPTESIGYNSHITPPGPQTLQLASSFSGVDEPRILTQEGTIDAGTMTITPMGTFEPSSNDTATINAAFNTPSLIYMNNGTMQVGYYMAQTVLHQAVTQVIAEGVISETQTGEQQSGQQELILLRTSSPVVTETLQTSQSLPEQTILQPRLSTELIGI